jgi:LysR family transcriptional regulator, hydrogen peroxide-inducible genes activator
VPDASCYGERTVEMHQIRYFLAVAAELNFTRASERCNVAQPSLTRAIRLLEEELGGQLFHRERANTHLSELGRIVMPHLQGVYDQTHAAKRIATDFASLKKTTLRLGIMCTVAPGQLVDLLKSTTSRNPGIELTIVDASAKELKQRLLAGDLEVAIYCLPAEPDDDDVHSISLFREQMMIVLPPSHPLVGCNAIRPKDLQGASYLNRVNCEFNGYAGRFFGDGVTWKMVYRSERDDWILAMIKSGLGFGFMPEFAVTDPDVAVRPLVEPEFWREVKLVTVRGRPHSPAVGAFVREAMRAKWNGDTAI